MNTNTTGQNKYHGKRRQHAFFTMSGLRLLQCLSGALLILGLFVTYGILFSSHGILRYHQQSRQLEEMETKVKKSREENQQLFHRIQSLKNNPLMQERLVRDQLGWARENELVFEFFHSGPQDR